jgi:uncharacterized protein (DUF4415 family)
MATKKSLQAAAATSGMFTAAKEEPKQAKPKKATRQQAQTVTEPEPKRTKETFSVKIDSEVLKKWRVYTSIDGYGDKGRLTEAAILEYMNRHKLTGDKLKKFETLTSID